MSQSKSYNRIVFLTTLSLYLGLVLVGGTAPVLAHSATTKSFDVHNEIEVKDDLDNKPDDCKELEEVFVQRFQSLSAFQALLDLQSSPYYQSLPSFQSLPVLKRNREIFSDYALSLKDLILFGKDNGLDKFSIKFDTDYEEYEIKLQKPILFSTPPRTRIEENLKRISRAFYIGPFSGYNDISGNFDYDQNYSKLKVSFPRGENKDVAAQYSSAYKDNLTLQLCKFQNLPERVIYENTKVSVENNQVFIVTRLPRAAIDSLLAQKDAQ